MKTHKTSIVFLLLLASEILLAPVTSFAQKGIVKHALKRSIPLKIQQRIGSMVSNAPGAFSLSTSSSKLPYTPLEEAVEGVALTDGKTYSLKKHSIAPSAVTVIGSDAIERSGEKSIVSLRQQAREETTSEYLAPNERKRWRTDFETLRTLWLKEEPSKIENLTRYLTHPVRTETFEYLQKQYQTLVTQIREENRYLMSKVIYSFLRNEGRSFSIEERRHINEKIYKISSDIRVLSRSLNKDPYLLAQQRYWDNVFTTFNPLLKGIMAYPSAVTRSDKRLFVPQEFNLYYPDGSLPYIKDSHSLIEGDDDYDDDEDSYAAVREKMRNPPITQEQAAKERAELLPYIPKNLKIAIINDDRPPLINFRIWCQKGYLGEGATLDEFSDGFAFMETVRNGTRYDLVITDLLVPNGGVAMMEDFRFLDQQAIVIASSKFYPGEGDTYSQKDLFNAGIDGYMWYNSNLNEGMYGYIQYLRQMKLYFDYKKQYGWSR